LRAYPRGGTSRWLGQVVSTKCIDLSAVCPPCTGCEHLSDLWISPYFFCDGVSCGLSRRLSTYRAAGACAVGAVAGASLSAVAASHGDGRLGVKLWDLKLLVILIVVVGQA
jgi:hypothetical protein